MGSPSCCAGFIGDAWVPPGIRPVACAATSSGPCSCCSSTAVSAAGGWPFLLAAGHTAQGDAGGVRVCASVHARVRALVLLGACLGVAGMYEYILLERTWL